MDTQGSTVHKVIGCLSAGYLDAKKTKSVGYSNVERAVSRCKGSMILKCKWSRVLQPRRCICSTFFDDEEGA